MTGWNALGLTMLLYPLISSVETDNCMIVGVKHTNKCIYKLICFIYKTPKPSGSYGMSLNVHTDT